MSQNTTNKCECLGGKHEYLEGKMCLTVECRDLIGSEKENILCPSENFSFLEIPSYQRTNLLIMLTMAKQV